MVSPINYNRISGLASGLDTDTLVKQMVAAKSTQLNKLQQAKILNSWKTDAYREINTKLDDFRKSVEGLRLQSTFNKYTVSSNQSNIVGVSITGSPSASNYTISQATLAEAAQGASVSFKGTASGRTTEIGGNDFSFDLTGTGTAKIDILATDTIDQVISKINNQSSTTGIKASYFDGNGSIVLNTVDTGSTANIKIENASGVNALGIVDGVINDPLRTFENQSFGTDLKPGTVTINGLKMDINSNSFTYDGIKFELKTPINGQQVSIQTAKDTQGIFDSIKTFVDKYNQLINDLNSKISEKKYRDFPPLTDDQKKDMKDNDIKKWEEKAQSGLLNNDSTVSDFLTKLRSSISESVGGITQGFKTLSDIGIQSSTSYLDNGKLELDETKLKAALNSDLDGVMNLFTQRSTLGNSSDTTVTNKAKHDETGFGFRIYDRINSAISSLARIAGAPGSGYSDTKSDMALQLKTINDNLFREQDRISRYEESLYKKFTAMETALSKLNSQSSWLSQQLGLS